MNKIETTYSRGTGQLKYGAVVRGARRKLQVDSQDCRNQNLWPINKKGIKRTALPINGK